MNLQQRSEEIQYGSRTDRYGKKAASCKGIVI